MRNAIKRNPALAAAVNFILTWMAFPVAALLYSHLHDTTFAEAAGRPYLITVFALGSVVGAVSTYRKKASARS